MYLDAAFLEGIEWEDRVLTAEKVCVCVRVYAQSGSANIHLAMLHLPDSSTEVSC